MSWEPWWGTGSTHRIAVPLENLGPIFDFSLNLNFKLKDFVVSSFHFFSLHHILISKRKPVCSPAYIMKKS